MPLSRREKIEAMLVDEPHDTFLRYSLALELAKEGDLDAAISRLRELTCDAPPYVPAFFQAAQLLVPEDRLEEARAFLRDGIEHAREQGNSHAAGEMSQYLSSLGMLGE